VIVGDSLGRVKCLVALMRIPFIDLQRTVLRLKKDALEGWQHCIDSCEFVGGRAVTQFERRMEERFAPAYFVSCANGTDAIIIALQAAGIGPGMKVALPNLTFWATYEAVIQIGASPVLIDIDEDDLQMNFDEFRLAFERFHFEAAILVHLFGWASGRLFEFRRFCCDRDIRLIEDGAQSCGVEVANGSGTASSVFAEADLATLSFYPTKVYGGCMDGGGITLRSKETAELCRCLANHGRIGHYSYAQVGWNSRMSGIQAAYLLAADRYLDEIITLRRQALLFYTRLLEPLNPDVRLHLPPAACNGNGYLAVLRLKRGNAIQVEEALRTDGVDCARIYPETIDMQKPAEGASRVSDLSVSKEFCKTVLNLPLFPGK